MKKLTSLLFTGLVLLAMALPATAQAPLQYRVDTVAALRAITLYGSDAKVVAWVGGNSARDDGLGGVFFYDGNSSAATNVYAVFKPANNNGRWFKLPTAVAWQNSAVTVGDDTTYGFKFLRGPGQTNFFGIGADNNIAYLQTFNGKNLHINNLGNDVIVNGAATGALIAGNTLAVTNGTTLAGGAVVGTAATAVQIKQILTATAALDFPSIPANSFTNLTITVAGAGTNSTVIATPVNGTGLTAGVILGQAWVSATNTVTIQAVNVLASGAVDAAALGVRTTVIQY